MPTKVELTVSEFERFVKILQLLRSLKRSLKEIQVETEMYRELEDRAQALELILFKGIPKLSQQQVLQIMMNIGVRNSAE